MRKVLLFLNKQRFFLIILLLTYIVRTTLLFLNDFNIIKGDSLLFLKYAQNLSEYFVFSDSAGPPILPTANRMPGLPFFMSITTILWGLPNISVIFYLMFIDFLSAFVVFKICIELFNNIKIARISSVLFTICPAVGLFSTNIMAETLSIFLILCSIYFLIKFSNNKEKIIFLVLCSFFLALSSLTKPNYALLPVAFACTFFLKKGYLKEKIKYSFLLLLFFGLFISPWITRNTLIYKSIIMRTVNGGNENLSSKERAPFRLWLTTWMFSGKDYELYWRIDTSINRHISTIDYAFSSEKEKSAILLIISNFKKHGSFSEKDRELLTEISKQKIKKAPITYYLLLPLKRTIYMWKSKHIALLGTDSFAIKTFAAAINLFFYIGFGFGIVLYFKEIPHISILLSLLFYSSFFHGFFRINYMLATAPAYVIQSFPVLIIITGLTLYKISQIALVKKINV